MGCQIGEFKPLAKQQAKETQLQNQSGKKGVANATGRKNKQSETTATKNEGEGRADGEKEHMYE